MIVDSSAVLAILFREEDTLRFAEAIEAATTCRMSAANFLEAAIRIDRGGNAIASDAFDDFIRETGILIEPATVEHAHLARRAYRAYGEGTGHPTKLNFGDCFAYALAEATGEPPLFKGDDFAHTDLRSGS